MITLYTDPEKQASRLQTFSQCLMVVVSDNCMTAKITFDWECQCSSSGIAVRNEVYFEYAVLLATKRCQCEPLWFLNGCTRKQQKTGSLPWQPNRVTLVKIMQDVSLTNFQCMWNKWSLPQKNKMCRSISKICWWNAELLVAVMVVCCLKHYNTTQYQGIMLFVYFPTQYLITEHSINEY